MAWFLKRHPEQMKRKQVLAWGAPLEEVDQYITFHPNKADPGIQREDPEPASYCGLFKRGKGQQQSRCYMWLHTKGPFSDWRKVDKECLDDRPEPLEC